MGWSEGAIKVELQQDVVEQFEIWPEHIESWNLFLSVQHQWRYAPMGGGALGLDYPSVRSVLKLMFPKKRHKELFMQLQVIEAGALKFWPKRK